MQKKDVMSTLTTNEDIKQMALMLWSNSDYAMRTLTAVNVLAKYRAKIARTALKMQREAMFLGECLTPPNKDAFLSLPDTKGYVP